MYVQALFNQRGMFQHVGGWLAKSGQADKFPIQQMLFHASCVYLAMNKLESLKRQCEDQFDEYRNRLGETHDRIAFFSPQFLEMLIELSPCFAALRLAQNDVLRAVERALPLKSSIPSSMHDAIKSIHKYGLPTEIVDRTMQYWEGSGKNLKHYRDIDQHYYSLADHAFMQTKPERKLVVLLPDDPAKKGRKNATYTEEIDALDFLYRSFHEFHSYADDLARFMGYEPKPLEASVWHGAGDKFERKDGVIGLIIPGTKDGTPFILRTTANGPVIAEWLD